LRTEGELFMNVSASTFKGRAGAGGRGPALGAVLALVLASALAAPTAAAAVTRPVPTVAAAAAVPADYYVLDEGANLVSEVDIATGSVVANLYAASPLAAALDPVDGRLYVSDDQGDSSAIQVFDTATNTQIGAIDTNDEVPSITIGGGQLFGAESDLGEIFAASTGTDQITARFPLDSPIFTAVSPDGEYLYVVGFFGILWKIDIATEQPVWSVDLATAPEADVLSPDGAYFYAEGVSEHTGKGVLDAIDTATGQIAQSRKVGVSIDALAVSPSGDTVYAVGGNAAKATAFSTGTLDKEWSVSLPQGSYPDAVAADGSDIFVSEFEDAAVAEFSLATHKLVRTAAVGADPTDIVLLPPAS
jgi:DNA-binding beta-propeller fold protein YncE